MATNPDAPLTGQQQLFVFYFLKIGIATKAAELAGYSKKSIGSQSSQLMANPKIKKAIAQHRKKMQEKLEITQETLLRDAEIVKERSLYGDAVIDEDGDQVDIVGIDGKTALTAIATQAKLLGLGGYGQAKVTANVQVNNINGGDNYKYDLTKLEPKERKALGILLAKARIAEAAPIESDGEAPKQLPEKSEVIDVTALEANPAASTWAKPGSKRKKANGRSKSKPE